MRRRTGHNPAESVCSLSGQKRAHLPRTAIRPSRSSRWPGRELGSCPLAADGRRQPGRAGGRTRSGPNSHSTVACARRGQSGSWEHRALSFPVGPATNALGPAVMLQSTGPALSSHRLRGLSVCLWIFTHTPKSWPTRGALVWFLHVTRWQPTTCTVDGGGEPEATQMLGPGGLLLPALWAQLCSRTQTRPRAAAADGAPATCSFASRNVFLRK